MIWLKRYIGWIIANDLSTTFMVQAIRLFRRYMFNLWIILLPNDLLLVKHVIPASDRYSNTIMVNVGKFPNSPLPVTLIQVVLLNENSNTTEVGLDKINPPA